MSSQLRISRKAEKPQKISAEITRTGTCWSRKQRSSSQLVMLCVCVCPVSCSLVWETATYGCKVAIENCCLSCQWIIACDSDWACSDARMCIVCDTRSLPSRRWSLERGDRKSAEAWRKFPRASYAKLNPSRVHRMRCPEITRTSCLTRT